MGLVHPRASENDENQMKTNFFDKWAKKYDLRLKFCEFLHQIWVIFYTLCEYTSCEVVLRTMFCRLQNIHRAVLVASLVRGTDSPLLELLPLSPSDVYIYASRSKSTISAPNPHAQKTVAKPPLKLWLYLRRSYDTLSRSYDCLRQAMSGYAAFEVRKANHIITFA